MKHIQWDNKKSELLKRTRGVSFEEMIQSKLITVVKHPKKSHQNLMLFEYGNYIWVVPFVEDNGKIFLKTLFPSRKYTKVLKGEKL